MLQLHISVRDALSGLLNRRALQPRLTSELNRADRHKKPLSLLLFDIDHFKQVNDNYGHRTGDLAIQHVVDIASNQLRDYDLLFRYGGEEFLICLPDTPAETALVIATRLKNAVAAMPMSGDPAIRLTLSIGITSTNGMVELDPLIEQADTALYQAKQSGRNTVVRLNNQV